jgi:hypothetical protein
MARGKNYRQDVIEIVGNAPSEAPDALKFLSLDEPILKLVALPFRFAKAFFLAQDAFQGALADDEDQTTGTDHKRDALHNFNGCDGDWMLKLAENQFAGDDDPDQRKENVEESYVGGRKSDFRLALFGHKQPQEQMAGL